MKSVLCILLVSLCPYTHGQDDEYGKSEQKLRVFEFWIWMFRFLQTLLRPLFGGQTQSVLLGQFPFPDLPSQGVPSQSQDQGQGTFANQVRAWNEPSAKNEVPTLSFAKVHFQL